MLIGADLDEKQKPFGVLPKGFWQNAFGSYALSRGPKAVAASSVGGSGQQQQQQAAEWRSMVECVREMENKKPFGV